MLKLDKNTKELEKNEQVKITKNKKERSKYWDIVKGIGILSIVIGHSTSIIMLHNFVYTFHLVIFYFIAIYFYNENKYGEKPFDYFAHRLKSVWGKYVFCSTIIILLHNFFLKYNFYTNMKYYTNVTEYIIRIINAIILKGSEHFLGALWFVPTLVIASSIFAGIVYISRKINNILKENENEETIKYIFIIILSVFIGIIGIVLNTYGIGLAYEMHTVCLIMPICSLAYFFRILVDKFNKFEKINKWYIALILAILSIMFIYLVVVKNGIVIDLAQEKIINGYMFYIVSIVGIIFCLSISKIIELIPIINKWFIVLGKNSFYIMAFHFVCIKLVDVIYARIINETNPTIIGHWVSTYSEKLWIIYVIVGTVLPILISFAFDLIKRNINNYINDKK